MQMVDAWMVIKFEDRDGNFIQNERIRKYNDYSKL